MLYFKETVGHIALVKPNDIYRPCPVGQILIREVENMDGGANILQGFFEKLAILVLGRHIGLVVFHVAYGDDQSLIVAMRKLLLALFLVGQKVKFAHHFLATILQGPKARLDFEDLLRLLHDSPDGLVGRLGRPRFRIDKTVQVAQRGVSTYLAEHIDHLLLLCIFFACHYSLDCV